MGTISRFNVYSSGDLLTAANLNGSLDRIHNLINGGLDRFNVDYSSSDGIMVLDQAQTVTGNKTYNANLTISADTATNSLDVASHNASSAGLKLAGTLVTATAAELNKMDGVTSSTTELNLLDGITAINDQDDMSGNSATALATQQSIKAYVDAQIATEDTIAELNDTTIGSLAAGNVLIYDGTDSWDNKPLTGDVTITAGGVTAIEAGVILNADINASAAIADTKLATISTSDKVSGSAVQLASTSALENSTGLRIKSGTAGTGLSLASQVLSVDASQTQITAVGTIATGTWEATDVAVAHGGTGSSTASGARTNLGVAVGSDVQAYDAGLASIAGLTTAANKMIYTTGADTYAVIDLTSIGRDILADVDAAAVRTTIGAQASGSYQTSDAGLTSIAGLTTAANKMIYTTGADTYTVADLTSVGRDIIAGADAAAVRTTIGAQASGTYSTLAYKTIAVSGQDNVVADAADDTLTFAAGTGITLTTTAGTDTLTITNSATGANAFGTIAVSGQDNVVADSTGDTLTLAAGSNITLTTTAGSDTVTIAAGSSGHTIQEEGSGLTARANLNFVGSGVTATDDSGNNATKVTVSASGASLPFTNSNGGSDAIALTSAAIGESLVTDTTPQLGGDLDVNGNDIVSVSNGNINIAPNGSGVVQVGGTALLANDTNNRVTTATGSGTLNGEANLTFDGTDLAIGNAAPSSYMNSVHGLIIGDTSDATSEIAIATTTTGTAEINFTDTADTTNQAQISYTHSNANFDFKTAQSGGILKFSPDTGGSVLLQVGDASSNARVGIGTTAPDHIFHAQDIGANSFNTKFVLDLENTRRSGYTEAAIELASEYGTPGAGNFRTSAIAAQLIGDQTATDIVFYSESAERARITNAGRVGINTLTPGHTFQSVRNTTTADVFSGSFIDTTSSYQLEVVGQSGAVTGTGLWHYSETSSPADNDFAGAQNIFIKDSGGNKSQIGSCGWFVTDVTAGTLDSYFYLRVYSNSGAVAGTLSTAGVWTDSSAAANKEYYGTRQEVWPDGVLGSLKTLKVSKYKQANLPDGKLVTETHVSPTAEDFWDTFQIGQDPRREVLNAEGEQILNPSIAPKDLSGVALVAVQELLERVEAAEAKIAVLESA